MNDSQSIVSILIKFGLLDAQNADTALQKLQLLDEQKRSGILDTLKAADATKELGQAEEAGAEHAEHFHINHRAAHMIVHELAGKVPGLNEAIRGLTSSEMGALGPALAIAGAWAIWESRIKACEEALGAILLPDLSKGMDTIANLSQAWHGLADGARDAAEQYSSFSAAYDRAAAAINAEYEATKKWIEIKKEQRKMMIDLAVEEGTLSAAEGAAKKRIIDEGATKENIQAEIDARNLRLQAMAQEAAAAEKEAKDKAAQAAAIKDLGGPTSSSETAQREIENKKDVAKNARDQAEKIQHTLDIIGNANYFTSIEGKGKGSVDITTEGGRAAAAVFGIGAKQKDIEAQVPEFRRMQASLNQQAEAEERAAGVLIEENKKREKLREEATKAEEKAKELKQKVIDESDANRPGSIAWQNNQDQAQQGAKTATENMAGVKDDFHRVEADIHHVPSAKDRGEAFRDLKDAQDAINDAAVLMEQLAKSGMNIKEMRTHIANLQDAVNHLNEHHGT